MHSRPCSTSPREIRNTLDNKRENNTMTTDRLTSAHKARCQALTQEVADAVTDGRLTQAEGERLLNDWWGPDDQPGTVRRQASELDEDFAAAIARSKPRRFRSWNFRNLKPGTLPDGIKAYGPGPAGNGQSTWGRDKGHISFYDFTKACEWLPEGLKMRIRRTGKKITVKVPGSDPVKHVESDEVTGTYLTTRPVGGKPGVPIPFFCRVEAIGRWTPMRGLWFAILWLVDHLQGAGKFEADVNEHMTIHGLDVVKCVLHGRLVEIATGKKLGTVYNIGTRYLKHPSNLVGKGIDWSAEHMSWIEIRPLNDGRDAEFAMGVDDNELVTLTTVEMRAAGVEFDGGLPEWLYIDSCTEAGGEGGGLPLPAAYNDEGFMVLSEINVDDLRPEPAPAS